MNPCKNCIVSAICSESCDKLVNYIHYFLKNYKVKFSLDDQMISSIMRVSSTQNSEVGYYARDKNNLKLHIICENGEITNVEENNNKPM